MAPFEFLPVSGVHPSGRLLAHEAPSTGAGRASPCAQNREDIAGRS